MPFSADSLFVTDFAAAIDGMFFECEMGSLNAFRRVTPVADIKLITETTQYLFGNFRKLSLYNCFMPI